MSIPKIIHLCWFGRGHYPQLANMCINSWKEFLPEYEIRIWNEDNFDVECCSYTKKAFEEGKWAFISDYARLIVLHQFGGVYMDTDLEVIADFSHLLEGKRFVSSYIEGGLITAGFIACEAQHPYVKELINYYDMESEKLNKNEKIEFVMNPLIYTQIAIEKYGFKLTDQFFCNDVLTIYPLDYFMPYKKFAFGTSFKHWHYLITNNTFTIHHDMSSWHKGNKVRKFINACVRMILPKGIYNLLKIRKNLKKIKAGQ